MLSRIRMMINQLLSRRTAPGARRATPTDTMRTPGSSIPGQKRPLKGGFKF